MPSENFMNIQPESVPYTYGFLSFGDDPFDVVDQHIFIQHTYQERTWW